MAPYHIVQAESRAAEHLHMHSSLPQLLQLSSSQDFSPEPGKAGVSNAYGLVPVSPLFIPNLNPAIGRRYANRRRSIVNCGRQIMTTVYIVCMQDSRTSLGPE